jgi:DNA-directed RNA polymerase subunit RPC12/RpoP
MKRDEPAIPCVLCKRPLVQRTDKNDKPYFVCDDCGTQLFVRGSVGRRLLDEVMRNGGAKAIEKTRPLLTKTQALAINSDLEALNGYVETFCEDEIIIPPGSPIPDGQVLFTVWTCELCDRISKLVRSYSPR